MSMFLSILILAIKQDVATTFETTQQKTINQNY